MLKPLAPESNGRDIVSSGIASVLQCKFQGISMQGDRERRKGRDWVWKKPQTACHVTRKSEMNLGKLELIRNIIYSLLPRYQQENTQSKRQFGNDVKKIALYCSIETRVKMMTSCLSLSSRKLQNITEEIRED